MKRAMGVVRRRVVTKTSTGLVGLAVDPDGRKNLIDYQEKILKELSDIPEDAAYRVHTEAITRYRLKTALEIEDEDALEAAIGQGQLEELIEEAKDELGIITMYKDAKMWDVVKDLHKDA